MLLTVSPRSSTTQVPFSVTPGTWKPYQSSAQALECVQASPRMAHVHKGLKHLSSLGQLKATGRFVKKWLCSAPCLFSDYRTVYNSSFYTIRAPLTFIINDEIILSTTRTLRLPMGCVCLHCHFLDAIKKRGRAVFHLGNLQLG